MPALGFFAAGQIASKHEQRQTFSHTHEHLTLPPFSCQGVSGRRQASVACMYALGQTCKYFEPTWIRSGALAGPVKALFETKGTHDCIPHDGMHALPAKQHHGREALTW